jgi:outer membrane immunogenic protein
MRFEKVLLPMMFVALSLAASAQAVPSARFGLETGQVAPVEIGLGYAYFHANAPPSGCGCFSLNGGAGSIAVNATHGISFVVDLTGAHASQVNGTAQNITIFDYLIGPRYSFRSHSRYTPYVQGLLGGSTEYTNTVNLTNTSAFAVSGGIGVNTVLGRHWGWNIVEADYVYSRLPNGVNSYQSDFRASSNLLLRF